MGLMPSGEREGRTWLGRAGDFAQQPPLWAGLAALLAVAGGQRGRAAALRGAVCYSVAGVVANLVVKPVVGRDRPPGAGKGRPGPVTSSFPSGHSATDLAFAFGASQHIPALFPPLAAATLVAHWSLVRSRGHYSSDVLAGGVIAVAVAGVAWRFWPPAVPEPAQDPESSVPQAGNAR